MSFKDMVAADNKRVFLNLDEFAERRTVWYDEVAYEDIPVVLTGRKEAGRRKLEETTPRESTRRPMSFTAPWRTWAAISRNRVPVSRSAMKPGSAHFPGDSM